MAIRVLAVIVGITAFLASRNNTTGHCSPADEPADSQPVYAAEFVFPFDPQHNHAPGIAELANGELIVSWYRGSGERSADDVAVFGARRKAVAAGWGETFLMTDTPGFPDLQYGDDGRCEGTTDVVLACHHCE